MEAQPGAVIDGPLQVEDQAGAAINEPLHHESSDDEDADQPAAVDDAGFLADEESNKISTEEDKDEGAARNRPDPVPSTHVDRRCYVWCLPYLLSGLSVSRTTMMMQLLAAAENGTAEPFAPPGSPVDAIPPCPVHDFI